MVVNKSCKEWESDHRAQTLAAHAGAHTHTRHHPFTPLLLCLSDLPPLPPLHTSSTPLPSLRTERVHPCALVSSVKEKLIGGRNRSRELTKQTKTLLSHSMPQKGKLPSLRLRVSPPPHLFLCVFTLIFLLHKLKHWVKKFFFVPLKLKPDNSWTKGGSTPQIIKGFEFFPPLTSVSVDHQRIHLELLKRLRLFFYIILCFFKCFNSGLLVHFSLQF